MCGAGSGGMAGNFVDVFTAGAYIAIIVLVIANAWIVTRLDIEVRKDDD